MLKETTPAVRRHAAWLLSLRADADGDSHSAQQWIRAIGDPERLEILPRLWADVSDEVQMARLALAVGDRELAESAGRGRRASCRAQPGCPVDRRGGGSGSRAVRSRRRTVVPGRIEVRTNLPRSRPRRRLGRTSERPNSRARPRDPGIDALSNALVLFSRIGASRDAAAAPQPTARTRGAPPGHQGRRSPPRVGWR